MVFGLSAVQYRDSKREEQQPMNDRSIYQVENAFTQDLCERIIAQADTVRLLDDGPVQHNRELNRLEDCISLFDNPNMTDLVEPIEQQLQPHWEAYQELFPVLKLAQFDHKLLKYNHAPRYGGIQFWHCEQRSGAEHVASRAAVWMVYLNDVELGGETEFLYQQLRIQAKEGRLVIFPATYTHTHRSAPVWDERKDVITGVFNFEVFSG